MSSFTRIQHLCVLDQSPVAEGSSRGDALRNSIDLARFTERLGYRRYWVAEHHATPALASASPEVLMGPIASATSKIHVGSGGIMLPHYSPLKVAESFKMLEGLYPGRIDLGVGRAAGTSPRVSRLLLRDRRQAPPDDFPDQLTELRGYLAEGPEVWLLGSSGDSAVWAADMGLPYVFADFINREGAEIARGYRERARKPYVGVATWAICAETDDEAQALTSSMRMMMTLLFRGQLIEVPTVERAQAFLAAETMPGELLPVGRRIIAGNPDRVKAAIEQVAEDYEADEVFIVNIMHDHAARRRSYELIAEAFGIPGASRS
jgi:luciferase family oxidoreductase group 1